MTEIDTLLNLCPEQKNSGDMEADMKRLTHRLPDFPLAPEKDVIKGNTTMEAVAAAEVAEKYVVTLTEEHSGVKTTYVHAIFVRSNEAEDMKMQLTTTQKRTDDTKYENNRAECRL